LNETYAAANATNATAPTEEEIDGIFDSLGSSMDAVRDSVVNALGSIGKAFEGLPIRRRAEGDEEEDSAETSSGTSEHPSPEALARVC
jgi:hypothetical protein